MKKATILSLALVCSYILAGAQLSNPNKMNELYLLGRTFIYFSNDFIQTDNDNGARYPFSADAGSIREYSVTGPQLTANILEMDSTDVMHGSFSFNSDMIADTSLLTRKSYGLHNLQARVTYNGSIINNWQDVTAYPVYRDSSIYVNGQKDSYKITYSFVNRSLAVGDKVSIEIKQKYSNKMLANMHIKRVSVTVQPFLASMVHDSSTSESADRFIQQQVSGWLYLSPEIDASYNNHLGQGLQVINQKYYPSSKLAFRFRKPEHYRDSSLEYKLTGGAYKDTTWQPSGHLILVPRMQANASYVLQVRYKNSSIIATYTFSVPPAWYQKYMYLLVYIPAFLILFFATVFIARYRIKKIKQRKEKLAFELKSIRSQLNPHFVFNALSSIQALINKNEIELANQYLTEFSSLLRESLQNHQSDLVPIATDIKLLEHYIKLEQLRFNFLYEIKTGEHLNLNTIDIPAMLLQPLVENAIKHGIALLKEDGRLYITYSRQGDDLLLTVADNGRGFDTTVVQDGRHGLRLTKERIDLLNKSLKGQHAQMEIISNTQGTTIIITFKHWLPA